MCVKLDSWRAKRLSGLRNKDGMLSGPAAPLHVIFFMTDSNSPIWSGAQLLSSTDGALRRFLNCWFEFSIGLWHVEFADLGVVIYEYVGFGFDVGDGLTFLGHCFVWRVSIRSTVQTSDDFPHVWATWIQHCILKEIFLTFCLDLVDCLVADLVINFDENRRMVRVINRIC